jgi:hypothetical protein
MFPWKRKGTSIKCSRHDNNPDYGRNPNFGGVNRNKDGTRAASSRQLFEEPLKNPNLCRFMSLFVAPSQAATAIGRVETSNCVAFCRFLSPSPPVEKPLLAQARFETHRVTKGIPGEAQESARCILPSPAPSPRRRLERRTHGALGERGSPAVASVPAPRLC